MFTLALVFDTSQELKLILLVRTVVDELGIIGSKVHFTRKIIKNLS